MNNILFSKKHIHQRKKRNKFKEAIFIGTAVVLLLLVCTKKAEMKVQADETMIAEDKENAIEYVETAESLIYYPYVRDVLIPEYGLARRAVNGLVSDYTTQWLTPDGIITAWIGDLDGIQGDEMIVFRMEMGEMYGNGSRWYDLMLDLYTIEDRQVILLDSVKAAPPSGDDGYDEAGIQSNTTMERRNIDVYEIDGSDTVPKKLYFESEHIPLSLHPSWGEKWSAGMSGESLSIGTFDESEPEGKKTLLFNLIIDFYEPEDSTGATMLGWRVVDSCRLMSLLDTVFADKAYLPQGMLAEYAAHTDGGRAAAERFLEENGTYLGDTAGQTTLTPDTSQGTRSGAVYMDFLPNLTGEKRIAREETYENGLLDTWYQYLYEENGLLVLETYSTLKDGLRSAVQYEYDDAGNLIRETEVETSGKINYQKGYENDEKGNQIRSYQIKVTGEDQAITDWDEFDYDESCNKTERRGYRKGIYDFKYVYTYDAQGNMLSEERFDKDGNSSFRSEYVYDADGHKIRAYGVNSDGTTAETPYEWSDDYHTRTSSWFHSNGTLAGTDIYRYDDDGNRIEFETIYDSSGDVNVRKSFYE